MPLTPFSRSQLCLMRLSLTTIVVTLTQLTRRTSMCAISRTTDIVSCMRRGRACCLMLFSVLQTPCRLKPICQSILTFVFSRCSTHLENTKSAQALTSHCYPTLLLLFSLSFSVCLSLTVSRSVCLSVCLSLDILLCYTCALKATARLSSSLRHFRQNDSKITGTGY